MDDGPDFDFSQTQAFKDFDVNGLDNENVENGLQGSAAGVLDENVQCNSTDHSTSGSGMDAMDTGPGFEFSQTQAPMVADFNRKHTEEDARVYVAEKSDIEEEEEEEPTQQVISPSIPVHWSGVEAAARGALYGDKADNEAPFPYSAPALSAPVAVAGGVGARGYAAAATLADSTSVSDASQEGNRRASMAATIEMVENLTQTSAAIVKGLMKLTDGNSGSGFASAQGTGSAASSHRTPFELLSSRTASLSSTSGQAPTGAGVLDTSVNGPISEPQLVSVGKYHRRKFKFNAESESEEEVGPEKTNGSGGKVANVYDFDADDFAIVDEESDAEAEWSSQAFSKTVAGKGGVLSASEAATLERKNCEVDEFGIPEKLYADVVADSLLIYGNNNMQFRDVWEYLERYGRWTWRKGTGLVSFCYFRPGKEESDRLDEDYFTSEDDLLSFVYSKLMDRVRLHEQSQRKALSHSAGKNSVSKPPAVAHAARVASSSSASAAASTKVRKPLGVSRVSAKAAATVATSPPVSPTSLGSLSSDEEAIASSASEADSESEEEEAYASDSSSNLNGVDEHCIPFQLYRDVASDVQLRHSLKFKNVWEYLDAAQWTWRKGRGLVSFFHCKPGKTEKDVLNVDYFQHEDDVLAYVMKQVHASRRIAHAVAQQERSDAQLARRAEREDRRVARRAEKEAAREAVAARKKARAEEAAKRRAKEAAAAEAEAKARAKAEAAALKLSKANLEKNERKLGKAGGKTGRDGYGSEAASSRNGRSRASSRDAFSDEEEEEEEEEEELPWQQRVMTMPWKELWKELLTEGWTWDYGSGLVYQWYIAPGVASKDDRVRDVNTFDSEMSVRSHVDSLYQKSARKSFSQSSKAGGASGRNRRRSGRGHEHPSDHETDGSGDEVGRVPLDWKQEIMTMPWGELWKQLQSEGWTWDYGSGLVAQWYIAPGVTSKSQRVRDVNTFDSEMSVRSHVDSLYQKSARKIATESSRSARRTSKQRRRGSRGSQCASDTESIRSLASKAESGAEDAAAESEEEKESDDEEETEPEVPAVALHWKQEIMTMPWKELWKKLMAEGWTWDYGSGLVAQWYIAPGVTSKSQRVRGENTFDSEDDVRRVARARFEEEGGGAQVVDGTEAGNGNAAAGTRRAESDALNSSVFGEEWALSRHRDKRGGSTEATPAKRQSPGDGAPATSSKKQKLRIAASPSDAIEHINNATRINQSHPRTPKKPRLSGAGDSASMAAPLPRRGEDYSDANPSMLVHYYHRFFDPENSTVVSDKAKSAPLPKSPAVFRSLVFVLTSLPEPIRSILCDQIIANGGIVLHAFPVEVKAVDAAGASTRYTSSVVSVEGRYHSPYSSEQQQRAQVMVSLSSLVVVALPAGCRRPNFLSAVATGTLIVHPLWVEHCVEQKTVVPFDRYVLPTGASVSGPYYTFPVRCPDATGCNGAKADNKVIIGCESGSKKTLLCGNSLFQDLRVMVLSCAAPSQANGVDMWTKLMALAGCTQFMEDYADFLYLLNRRLGLSEEDDEAELGRAYSSELVRFPVLPDVLVVDPLTLLQVRAFKAHGAGADIPNIEVVAEILDRLQRLCIAANGQPAGYSRGLSMYCPVHTQVVTIDWVSYCIAAGELVSPSLSPLFSLPGFAPAEQAQPVVKNRRPVTVFRGEHDRYVVNDIIFYLNSAPSSSGIDRGVAASPHKHVNRGVSVGRIVEMYETVNGAALPPAGSASTGSLIIKVLPIEARNPSASSSSDASLPPILTPKFLLRTKSESAQYSPSDCVMITPARLCGKPVVCSTHSVKHLAYLVGAPKSDSSYPSPFLSSSLWERQSQHAHMALFHSAYMQSGQNAGKETNAAPGSVDEDAGQIQAFSDFPMSQDV